MRDGGLALLRSGLRRQGTRARPGGAHPLERPVKRVPVPSASGRPARAGSELQFFVVMGEKDRQYPEALASASLVAGARDRARPFPCCVRCEVLSANENRRHQPNMFRFPRSGQGDV